MKTIIIWFCAGKRLSDPYWGNRCADFINLILCTCFPVASKLPGSDKPPEIDCDHGVGNDYTRYPIHLTSKSFQVTGVVQT